MRNDPERELALECLRLAVGHVAPFSGDAIPVAAEYFAFVTGTDTDDAKAKLEAVRKAVS